MISARSAVDLLVALGAVELLRVRLDVIALDEDRPGEPFAQRRGKHDGRVLVRPLLGVADLRPGDFEDERAGIQLLRRDRITARAVSYAIARTLIAGTVKPPASPRPIAM